jgi:hypothetical protein
MLNYARPAAFRGRLPRNIGSSQATNNPFLTSINFLYVKCVVCNLKHSHCRHVFNCSLLTLGFQTRPVSNSYPLKYSCSSQLAVKFHYSLIGSTVKILNTLFLLAHLRNAVAPLNSYKHLHVCYWSSLSISNSLSLSLSRNCYTISLQSPVHPELKC